MLVADAGAVFVALTGHGALTSTVRSRLSDGVVNTPHLMDVEVLSTLRRHARLGTLPLERAERAVVDLARLDVRRHPDGALLSRMWRVRENVSAYDAAYVALAQLVRGTLLTLDGRLAVAAEPWCDVELLAQK